WPCGRRSANQCGGRRCLLERLGKLDDTMTSVGIAGRKALGDNEGAARWRFAPRAVKGPAKAAFGEPRRSLWRRRARRYIGPGPAKARHYVNPGSRLDDAAEPILEGGNVHQAANWLARSKSRIRRAAAFASGPVSPTGPTHPGHPFSHSHSEIRRRVASRS